jgi:hypothetical protein
MKRRFAMHESPRCTATSKRTRGGGPKGKRNGRYKHGRFTAEAVANRRVISALLRQARALTTAVGN